jgi:hypothetical protein
MSPSKQGKRKGEVEVPDVSERMRRYPHLAMAYDRTHSAELGLEMSRRLLPAARLAALGAK